MSSNGKYAFSETKKSFDHSVKIWFAMMLIEQMWMVRIRWQMEIAQLQVNEMIFISELLNCT